MRTPCKMGLSRGLSPNVFLEPRAIGFSGVTTRHISSTVRIFRSEEVKADGHVAIYPLGAPKGGELLED